MRTLKHCLLCLTLVLMVACNSAPTAPPRCTDDFSPINPGTVVKKP